jgi:hypothetical protein
MPLSAIGVPWVLAKFVEATRNPLNPPSVAKRPEAKLHVALIEVGLVDQPSRVRTPPRLVPAAALFDFI